MNRLPAAAETADVNLIVEAMYQVAADPGRWVQLIEILADQPARDEAPASARRSLEHSEEIARLNSFDRVCDHNLVSQAFQKIADDENRKLRHAELLP